jgi:hypothetical protein
VQTSDTSVDLDKWRKSYQLYDIALTSLQFIAMQQCMHIVCLRNGSLSEELARLTTAQRRDLEFSANEDDNEDREHDVNIEVIRHDPEHSPPSEADATNRTESPSHPDDSATLNMQNQVGSSSLNDTIMNRCAVEAIIHRLTSLSMLCLTCLPCKRFIALSLVSWPAAVRQRPHRHLLK